MEGQLTNNEILDIYLKDGTFKTCLECQFAKLKDHRFYEDFYNDMILTVLEYDNKKLNDVHLNKHFNAWLSRIIINNLWSNTSKYYMTYMRYGERHQELTADMDMEDEE